MWRYRQPCRHRLLAQFRLPVGAWRLPAGRRSNPSPAIVTPHPTRRDPSDQAQARALQDANEVHQAERGDAFSHLVTTAGGWGGNPERDAVSLAVFPGHDDGQTAYRVTVGGPVLHRRTRSARGVDHGCRQDGAKIRRGHAENPSRARHPRGFATRMEPCPQPHVRTCDERGPAGHRVPHRSMAVVPAGGPLLPRPTTSAPAGAGEGSAGGGSRAGSGCASSGGRPHRRSPVCRPSRASAALTRGGPLTARAHEPACVEGSHVRSPLTRPPAGASE